MSYEFIAMPRMHSCLRELLRLHLDACASISIDIAQVLSALCARRLSIPCGPRNTYIIQQHLPRVHKDLIIVTHATQ